MRFISLIIALSGLAFAAAQAPPPSGNVPKSACCNTACTECVSPPDCGNEQNNLCNAFYVTCCGINIKKQKRYDGHVESVAYNEQGKKITWVN